MKVVRANLIDLIVLHGEDGRNAESGFLGINDGGVAASGGFFFIDGKLWAALNVYEPKIGIRIVRAVRRVLNEVPVPVYAPCNEAHPQAKRLMKVLGFEPTDEKRHGMTVWRK